jgi:hypothetical protein
MNTFSCLGLTEDYYNGYVHSIIEDLIPEEDVETAIENKTLEIKVYNSSLDSQVEQRLKNRIYKKGYFTHIKFNYINQKALKQPIEDSNGAYNNSTPTTEILPSGVIYTSPIADPKWPKFSVGYQYHFRNIYGRNIFSLSFGENLALWRHKNKELTYELGVQAGLFGLMDISKNPTTLVNSDYFVGFGVSFVHKKNWQNLIQISHLSSHLGDELLLSNSKLASKRINLSYETLKWLTAYKFDNIRPYIGLGYMVHRDPSNIKPITIEGGCDYISKDSFIFNTTRYVFGIHTHAWEENNYKPSINLRTGLQFENPIWQGRYLQFLIDYSHGKSRHGQFYKRNEHYLGLLVALSS